jgi:hypothetical protein
MIPIAYVFQIIVMVGFMFVPSPAHWSAYFMAVFQAGSGMVLIVTTQSYVAKRCPKMIRGMIMGIVGVFTSFGAIIYLQLIHFTVPSKTFSYGWVFGWVAVLDVVALAFLLVMICLGKYGQSAAHEDNALDEGNSHKPQSEGADSFGSEDNMEGIPFDQIIEEQDDDELMSTRRDSLKFGSVHEDLDVVHAKAGDLAGSMKRTNSLTGSIHELPDYETLGKKGRRNSIEDDDMLNTDQPDNSRALSGLVHRNTNTSLKPQHDINYSNMGSELESRKTFDH